MLARLKPSLSSGVNPCGEYRQFQVWHEEMNHRELRAMWRQLALFAKGYEKILTEFIESEDAHTYSI